MIVAPPPAADGSPRTRRRGRRARLTARFLEAVGHEVGSEDDLTPSTLARAAVRVLPVTAAGLSTTDDALRIPLGSSSAAAATAEMLQTSLGVGPCLDAAQAQASVAFALSDLRARWPLYAEKLLAETPFRAVVSIPLFAPGHAVFAALDLYTTTSRLDDQLDLAELDQGLGAPAAALLSTCIQKILDVDELIPEPGWAETSAGRRHNVWVAIGMVMASRSGSTRPASRGDALNLLRLQAQTQDRCLDDLATDVVDGRVLLRG